MPGTVWTKHKKPDEWVQNFGAESCAHAWEVPVGPEPRMVEAPAVASQFFQAYDVGQRVPMEFCAESNGCEGGLAFLRLTMLVRRCRSMWICRGRQSMQCLPTGGLQPTIQKREMKQIFDRYSRHTASNTSRRKRADQTQKRAQNRDTGLFSDSSSKNEKQCRQE